MAVDKFEVGKWYRFIGDKDLLTREAIDIADGNPKKCINIGKDPKEEAVFEGMKNPYAWSSNMWIWNRKSFIEVKAPSQSKTKNKYRSFTKDDIGKVFTIRQWDDMASEFGINTHGSINTPILFHPHMRKFCGNKIKAAIVYSQEVKIVESFNSFCPQMFEECIIKESKAGDTATVKSEGLMVNKEFLDTGKIDWMLGDDFTNKSGKVELKIKGQLSEKEKEAIKEDIKKRSSIYFSTPSISQPNWIEGFYNQPMPSTVKGFSGLIEEMNNVNNQDKTKFNTDLIKTEKLNFRMDR